MLKQIDWQMIAFIAGSLIQDFGPHIHFPKIYYWDARIRNVNNDDKVA